MAGYPPDDRLILAQWSQADRFVDFGRHDWDLGGRIEGGELQQWHVICAPGHPCLYAVIRAVTRNIDSLSATPAHATALSCGEIQVWFDGCRAVNFSLV